ncbi:hypothetical protein NAPIS_ORF01174, partial [Vairimorpha apis BRL 01]
IIKGFSDSVLSYMEIYNLNINNCKNLKELKNLIDYMNDLKFNISDLKTQFHDTSYLKTKMEIIDNLEQLNELLQTNSTDEFSTCINFLNIKHTLNSNLLNIQGVCTIKSEVELEIEKFMIKVYNLIFEYIFEDKIEKKEFLRIIQMMDYTDKFSKYLENNFEFRMLKLRPEKYPWDHIVLENEKCIEIDDYKLNNIKHNLEEVVNF